MTGEELARLFGMAERTLKRNTRELTHEDSLMAPEGGGHCMNWVIGHVIATRMFIFELIGLEPFWPKETAELYERGSKPLQDPASAMPLKELIATFGRTQQQLVNRLKNLDGPELNAPLEGQTGLLGKTKGEALAFLQWHEAYHMGQVGLLRRVAGKTGAIP